jgi:hypothetical protein
MSDLFDTKEVATVAPSAIVESVDAREDKLLATVLSSGNIEVLERYIALRKSEEERQARMAFEAAFSVMRAELPSVAKSRENGGTKSKYAPVEVIQSAWDPVIYKHGFSYSWREEALPEGSGKRIWLDLSGYGHTRSNYFDVPTMTGTAAMNAIQVAGAMSTYGRRYTFVAGIGGIVEGEDADGQIPSDEGNLRLELAGLRDMKNQAGAFLLAENARTVIQSALDVEEGKSNLDSLKTMVKRARKLVGGGK